MKEITIDAKNENLARVSALLDEFLDDAAAPVGVAMKVSVALEEMFVNVANYAYSGTDVPEDDRKVTVRIEDAKVNGGP